MATSAIEDPQLERNRYMPLLPYIIPEGAIIEATLVSSLSGQTIMNVQHYKLTGGSISDGQPYMGEACQILKTSNTLWVDAMLGSAGEGWRSEYIQMQVIYPTRRNYVRVEDGTPGSRAGTCLPPNCSACIGKQSPVVARGRQGRMEVAGALVDDQINGLWVANYLVLLNGIANGLEAVITVVGAVPILEPVILHRANPALSPFQGDCIARTTVRGMTRRVVGRGI